MAQRTRRPSPQTAAVLAALSSQPRTWRHGYALAAEVGLKSGSLYPILIRLSDQSLLESKWETDGPAGRPPRHLYRLSKVGLEFAAEHAELRVRARTTRVVREAWGS